MCNPNDAPCSSTCCLAMRPSGKPGGAFSFSLACIRKLHGTYCSVGSSVLQKHAHPEEVELTKKRWLHCRNESKGKKNKSATFVFTASGGVSVAGLFGTAARVMTHWLELNDKHCAFIALEKAICCVFKMQKVSH